MQTARAGNLKVAKATPGSGKRSKDDVDAMGLPNLLNKNEVSTAVNHQLFDVFQALRNLRGEEDQLKDAKKPFTGVGGSGGISEKLHWAGKLAARVVKFRTTQLTTSQEQEIVRTGLSPEEWLTFCSAMSQVDVFEQYSVGTYLTPGEQLRMMIFLTRVAHTPPTAVCSQIRYSKCKASAASACWFGAKEAFGSWYHKTDKKKQQTLNIRNSLSQIGLTTHTKEVVAQCESRGKMPVKKRPKDTEHPNKKKKSNPPTALGDEELEFPNQPEFHETEEEKDEQKKSTKPHKEYLKEDMEDDDDPQENQVGSDSDDSDDSEDESVEIVEKGETNSTDKDGDTPMRDQNQATTVETIPASPDQQAQPQNTKKAQGAKKQSKLPIQVTQEPADVVADRRRHRTRLQLMIAVKGHKTKTANQVFSELILSMFQAFKGEDSKVIIMPWVIADSVKLPAIKDEHSFPDSFANLRKYIDKCRPKNDRDVWVKIRIAHNLEPVHFTSTNDSATVYWFDDNRSKSFLCPLQNSDRSETIGAFLYSGSFIDPGRLTAVLQEELGRVGKKQSAKNEEGPKREIKIACRNKASREIEAKTGDAQVWRPMMARTMTHVEADHYIARTTNCYLNRRFNNVAQKNIPPPGNYKYLRYLPAPTYVTTGGGNLRKNMLKKHEAVIDSLELITTESIKHLDKEVDTEFDGKMTLRTFLMGLTFPLSPKKGAKTKALIHSVDWTSSGQDAGASVMITAYNDRSKQVEQLVQILPEFIEFQFNEQIRKAWMNHQVILQDVDFHMDDEGNWKGSWATEDDKMNADIFNEEMEFDIVFENLELVTKRRQILETEDASLHTFKMDGRSAQSSTNSVNANSASTSAASKASGSGGMTD